MEPMGDLSPRTPLRTRAIRIGMRVAIALAVVLVLRVGAYAVGKENAHALLDDQAEITLVERRDYLAARLEDVSDQSGPGGQFGGEWVLVTLSMTAMGTTNLAFAYPDTIPRARTIVDRCLTLALTKEARAFDTARWNEDALDTLEGTSPHIGYLGHLAIILEAKRILGGGEDPHEKPVLAALRRRVASGASPILETYPGERYTADNMVVAAAIALSEIEAPLVTTERATASAAVLGRFTSWLEHELLDAESGAIVFATDAEGHAKGSARGSGVGWNSLYLPFIDRAIAKRQATVLRDRFRRPLGPFGGALCEYDRCAKGAGDVDSGPVVLGTSPSGTGFAIAAAKTLDDAAWLDDMVSISEWVGVTISLGGKRRFLIGPLVGDAILLASMSARGEGKSWDGRYITR
ncbi:hypothetical protein BH09MYX1_BH09MYX1_11900 [soil metagenome]